MNSENAPKEIVQSFIDLANRAKQLMDENQQPSITQELGRLFLSTTGGGRRDESRQLLWVGAGESSASSTDTNNTSLATGSTTKRTIEEIWRSKTTSKKPQNSMSHKTTSGKTSSKFAIFFHVKPSDFRFVTWFMSILRFGLPRLQFQIFRTKTVILSHFSLLQKEYKD